MYVERRLINGDVDLNDHKCNCVHACFNIFCPDSLWLVQSVKEVHESWPDAFKLYICICAIWYFCFSIYLFTQLNVSVKRQVHASFNWAIGSWIPANIYERLLFSFAIILLSVALHHSPQSRKQKLKQFHSTDWVRNQIYITARGTAWSHGDLV